MKNDPTWITRALEGDLDEAESAEFLHALQQDPALREAWASHAELHGWLGPAMEPAEAREKRVVSCVEAANLADQDEFVCAVKRKIRRVQFRRRALWAAAAVWVIGIVGWWSMTTRTVATVVAVSAVNGSEAPVEDTRFSKGERLKIGSGLVELDLSGRGRMIVEGPAEIAWSGRMGASLAAGRVLLKVNERGHGYRLVTPQGSVVDLGTEFGVSLDPASGKVETHVIDGEVEALPGGGAEPIRLRENEALRFSEIGSERISLDQGAFYRSMPPRHDRNIGMVHWSMESTGTTVMGFSRNLGDEGATLELKDGPQEMEGPFGPALSFDGRSAYAETSYRGIGGNFPRTVAFWVNVPSDLMTEESYAMVSWGEFRYLAPGSVWQISINPSADDGAVGRLRVGVHQGKAIGTTDLRDGKWHHVAVVLYPAATPESEQQVMLFVDGEVEPASSRNLGKIDTAVANAKHGVWLGRDVASDTGRGRFFRGALDEVYIFDAALTQGEIRALMERNEAPSHGGHLASPNGKSVRKKPD